MANAIENIQLYRQQQEQSRRLAVVEERDRIGRDLHDGVIQSMYAVGLTLEDISSRADKAPSEVGPRIEEVVGDLNRAIGDIRSYPTFPIWLNIPLSKSSAFFKPLSICETLAVGMAIITP